MDLLRTVANGCERLRTVANGCGRFGNVERTHPQPPDPQSETGTLATHSGKRTAKQLKRNRIERERERLGLSKNMQIKKGMDHRFMMKELAVINCVNASKLTFLVSFDWDGSYCIYIVI